MMKAVIFFALVAFAVAHEGKERKHEGKHEPNPEKAKAHMTKEKCDYMDTMSKWSTCMAKKNCNMTNVNMHCKDENKDKDQADAEKSEGAEGEKSGKAGFKKGHHGGKRGHGCKFCGPESYEQETNKDTKCAIECAGEALGATDAEGNYVSSGYVESLNKMIAKLPAENRESINSHYDSVCMKEANKYTGKYEELLKIMKCMHEPVANACGKCHKHGEKQEKDQ